MLEIGKYYRNGKYPFVVTNIRKRIPDRVQDLNVTCLAKFNSKDPDEFRQLLVDEKDAENFPDITQQDWLNFGTDKQTESDVTGQKEDD
jgi:hypothetical protein